MENIIRKITAAVMPLYCASKFYPGTIWDHVSNVARFAKEFAAQLGANQHVAEAGGWLHDLGAALYGREDHHITGIREAVVILHNSGCPLELIGPITDCVYSHRGSLKMPLRTVEARCVAAGDAKDHFKRLDKLWEAQLRNFLPIQAYKRVSEELENDWKKIDPQIQHMLNGAYDSARRELLRIASQNGCAKGNSSKARNGRSARKR